MFYLFHGSNKDAAKEKMKAVVGDLLKKKPDASFFKFGPENWESSKLPDLLGGQGLFVQKYVIVLENVFENEEAKELVVSKLAEISESENIFIILEGKIDKPTLTKLEKKAAKSQKFEEKESGGKFSPGKGGENFPRLSEFNIFSLTDALGRKDRKSLWVIYQKALARDVVPEEIHSLLFWQVKSMILAASAKSAAESGLKPFVFSKAKSFLKNYSLDELKGISSKLVSIYHDAHGGEMNLESALEKFVLEI